MEQELKKINPALFNYFTAGGLYLEKVHISDHISEKKMILGKFVEEELYLNNLILLEANVKSLFKKILPSFSEEHISPLLIPVLGAS